jgi:hypothetical protein
MLPARGDYPIRMGCQTIEPLLPRISMRVAMVCRQVASGIKPAAVDHVVAADLMDPADQRRSAGVASGPQHDVVDVMRSGGRPA